MQGIACSSAARFRIRIHRVISDVTRSDFSVQVSLHRGDACLYLNNSTLVVQHRLQPLQHMFSLPDSQKR
jgi:muramoyltetrapeptide carboxypeptidase LdcA involved in peptidoglycan recycling